MARIPRSSYQRNVEAGAYLLHHTKVFSLVIVDKLEDWPAHGGGDIPFVAGN